MIIRISRPTRRFLVVFHYIAFLHLLMSFGLVDTTGAMGLFTAAPYPALFLTIVSFVVLYIMTGVLKLMSGRNFHKLDEREKLLAYEAHRCSYYVFMSITSLAICAAIIIIGNAGTEYWGSVLVRLSFVTFYAAWTLPASIIVWRESEIYRE